MILIIGKKQQEREGKEEKVEARTRRR